MLAVILWIQAVVCTECLLDFLQNNLKLPFSDNILKGYVPVSPFTIKVAMMQISIELTSIQLVFQIVLYPSKTPIIIFMYFHTPHPQSLPRYAKNPERSLDTTAQSEDAALPRQSTFYTNSSPYMYTKLKHSLCRNFTQQGFCSYGKRCQFAHGLQELRHNTSGNPSYKTRSCLAFIRDGFCFYGTRCNFIHESPRVEGEGKWRQIYANFREEMDMFRKEKQGGPRLMRMLDKSER